MSRSTKPKLVAFMLLKIGTHFRYDGALFVKTDGRIAWELRNRIRYKEWAFNAGEMVEVS